MTCIVFRLSSDLAQRIEMSLRAPKPLIAILLTVLLVAGVVFPATADAAITVKLDPIVDAHVDSTNADTSFGERSELRVSAGHSAFIMFDLSGIPTGAVIQSASLRLVPIEDVKAARKIGAHYCPDSTWTEFGITWNTAPTFSPNVTSTVTVTKSGTWYVWDVTTDVEVSFESAYKKLTLVMKSEDGGTEVLFGSKESYRKGAHDNRPLLVIAYRKSESSITCFVLPSTVPIGQNATVSGTVSPYHGGMTVAVTYNKPDGSSVTREVFTADDGSYLDTYPMGQIGSWSMKAKWAGDEGHEPSESSAIYFSVVKISSSIESSVSSETVRKGAAITVLGSIAPAHDNVTINVDYAKPEGDPITRTVATNSTGAFNDSCVPDVLGAWSVVASWAGDENHTAAESPAIYFNVTKGSSAIWLETSPGTVTKGDTIRVSGSIDPPHGGALRSL